MVTKKEQVCKSKIASIEITNDTITERAGLALFVRYIETTLIYGLFARYFGAIKKSKKGADVLSIIKQVLCFFVDGTYFCLTRFDELKGDKGYAEVIENRTDSMCSSHAIKRFFKAIHYYMAGNFRRILQKLFIWRLRIKKPDVIILGMDTMVMDNNDAKKREGVSPTYKKVNGFQPLQLNWGPYIIDAVFRGGSKHGNEGDTAKNMIKQAVTNIREQYNKEALIIIRFDAGFFDEELFRLCDEELKIGFIGGGKLFQDIKEYLNDVVTEDDLKTYDGANNTWQYFEFEDRRKTWDEGIYYRVFYTKPVCEGKQILFEFARPENLIYTNIGMNPELTAGLLKAGKEEYLQAEKIIESYHQRGADELVNEQLKNFGTEQLPFTRFESNAAFYYFMVIAFFLFECFKEDVANGVVDIHSYATTLRRKLIDIAGKIVHKAGKIILKVSSAVYERLHINDLWKKCNNAPCINTC